MHARAHRLFGPSHNRCGSVSRYLLHSRGAATDDHHSKCTVSSAETGPVLIHERPGKSPSSAC